MNVSSSIYESMFLFRFSFASISALCFSAESHSDIRYTVISGLMSKIRSCEGVDESLNRSAARFLRWLGSSWRDCTKKGVQCTKVTNCIFTRQSLNQHPTGGRKTRITMILVLNIWYFFQIVNAIWMEQLMDQIYVKNPINQMAHVSINLAVNMAIKIMIVEPVTLN